MAIIRAYVDANIFTYWLGKHPLFGEIAYNWIKKIENAQHGEYITSTLTIYEVLIIISSLTGKSLKDKSLVEGVIDSITNLRGLMINSLKH
ncbi:MAG: PIN domain-containing protein, partial [Nitrososphaerales archaeon]